jgi:hypothetical protein
MKKILIVGTIICSLYSTQSLAGKDNMFYSDPQYSNLPLLSIKLSEFTSNLEINTFFKALSNTSTPIVVINTNAYPQSSSLSIIGMANNKKIEFEVNLKYEKEAKIKKFNKIFTKATTKGYVLISNNVPIGVVSNYEGTDNFKPN